MTVPFLGQRYRAVVAARYRLTRRGCRPRGAFSTSARLACQAANRSSPNCKRAWRELASACREFSRKENIKVY